MFDEFNELYGLDKKPLNHNLKAMRDLISEELIEVEGSLNTVNAGMDTKPELVKELIDLVYITCQQMRERGVDIDAALSEVHRSNMSKALPELSIADLTKEIEIAKKRYPNARVFDVGEKEVLKCTETNKVIKPTTYSPAVITPDMYGE
jgi:phosphoribosyl-ATP pyrophosphohydrolase